MTLLESLADDWLAYKRDEKRAAEARRKVEDAMAKVMGLPPDLEGTRAEGRVKAVGRLNRKVNADKLQEIAAEHGTSEHLPNLFRWSAAINAKVWEATAEEITRPLLGAITTTPGRPTFSVTEPEEPK